MDVAPVDKFSTVCWQLTQGGGAGWAVGRPGRGMVFCPSCPGLSMLFALPLFVHLFVCLDLEFSILGSCLRTEKMSLIVPKKELPFSRIAIFFTNCDFENC